MILAARCQGMSRQGWCVWEQDVKKETSALWREARRRFLKVSCTHAFLHDSVKSVISEQESTVADTRRDKCALIYSGEQSCIV